MAVTLTPGSPVTTLREDRRNLYRNRVNLQALFEHLQREQLAFAETDQAYRAEGPDHSLPIATGAAAVAMTLDTAVHVIREALELTAGLRWE